MWSSADIVDCILSYAASQIVMQLCQSNSQVCHQIVGPEACASTLQAWPVKHTRSEQVHGLFGCQQIRLQSLASQRAALAGRTYALLPESILQSPTTPVSHLHTCAPQKLAIWTAGQLHGQAWSARAARNTTPLQQADQDTNTFTPGACTARQQRH